MHDPTKQADLFKVAWSVVLRETEWPVRWLFFLTLLLPACLAGAFAWQQRGVVLDESRNGAQRSVIALEEHAAKVMESHLLLMRQVESLSIGRSPAQIQTDGHLSKILTQATQLMAHMSIVAVTDANGRLLLKSTREPTIGMSVADQDYFIAQRKGHGGIFVSQPLIGPVSGLRQFAISIPRKKPNGEFDGIVYTAVSINYLTNFWRQFAPSDGYLVPLVREDGTILARYPALHNPERLASNGPFLTRIGQSRSGIYTAKSLVDGVERTNAYTQVSNFPVYLSYSVETRAALQQWKNETLPAVFIATFAATVLLALWLVVMRQGYEQRAAVRCWRQSVDDLKQEVARRERVEDALRQASKMEAIGLLAGGIAHDFNNLLAVITTKLELIKMLQTRGQHADAARHAKGALQIADKAAALTQRLLAFSRRQVLHPVATDVNQAILSLRELVESSTGPNYTVLISPTEERCYALCDPGQLETSLLNLAINSRDAMPDGGTITIETRLEFVESPPLGEPALAQGAYVVVSVSDTGHGMSKETTEKAIDPFFTTKPVGQGTGLGLSMVHGFAGQSGGTMRIESVSGSGTTVHVYLPRCAAPTETADEPAVLSAPR